MILSDPTPPLPVSTSFLHNLCGLVFLELPDSDLTGPHIHISDVMCTLVFSLHTSRQDSVFPPPSFRMHNSLQVIGSYVTSA